MAGIHIRFLPVSRAVAAVLRQLALGILGNSVVL